MRLIAGLYNGFLAAMLIWGLGTGRRDVKRFGLGCVVVAGVFGGITAKPTILLTQALPGLLAFVAVTDDLFALVVRPDRVQITSQIYQAKVARWVQCWPTLVVRSWEDGVGGPGLRRLDVAMSGASEETT